MKKLKLNRETVRQLTESDLQRVRGGTDPGEIEDDPKSGLVDTCGNPSCACGTNDPKVHACDPERTMKKPCW